MQQLAAYLKEREGFDSVVTGHGFASYKIQGEECYIRDIWIEPAHRKSGAATALADAISYLARNSGCAYLTGSVSTTCGDPTASTKVLLAYGFRIHSALSGAIIFRKEL